MKRTLTAIILMCLLVAPAMAGQKNFSYQGVLVDSVGVNMPDGAYNITFKIYEQLIGGTKIWMKTQSVDVADGRFNTIIGEAQEINLPYDVDYFLGITVGGDPEMTPRIELTAVPWAMYAHDVANGSITALKIPDNTVVRNINGLTDSIIVAGGPNVTVSTSTDSIIISSTAGGDADWTVNGNDMYSSPSGNVGIGKSNPVAKLEIDANSGWSLIADSLLYVGQNWVGVGRNYSVGSENFGVGSPNTSGYGGMYVEVGGPDGLPFYGYSTKNGTAMWHYYEGTTQKWHLNMGGNKLTVERATGNVGIGTQVPSAKLDVAGSAEVNGTLDVNGALDVSGTATLSSGVASANSLDFPATTRYLTIPGVALTPATDTTDFTKSSFGYVYAGSGSSSGIFYAPVHLPHGANITELRAFIYDNTPTYSANVFLYEGTMSTTGNFAMASVLTSAADASTTIYQLFDNTVSGNPVDNVNRMYYVRVFMSGAAGNLTRLYGIRISYTVTSPLP